MPEFTAPVDIGNRALHHCGSPPMDPTLGFSEQSKRALLVSQVYGKLRQAELERNVWTFATRKATLRAIDYNTMLLNAALWVSTTTYFNGSIVSDANSTLWISRQPNNLNNQPGGASTAWEPYFGPMTVSLFDSTQTYSAGELVYTAAGDGTLNVWLSLTNINALHPALSSLWSTQSTYFQNQVVQTYAAWASGTTYGAGATVTYTDGNTYTSLAAGNHNNIPPSSPTQWVLTPTLTLLTPTVPAIQNTITPPTSSPVIEWSQQTTYALGNFVMFNGSEYVSLVNSNTGNFPNASGSTSWAVLTGGTLYMSLIDLNIGNNPANAPAAWSSSTTYATGNQVYSPFTGLIYTSVGNGNLNHDPSTDGGVNWTNTNVLAPWASSFSQGGGNDQWLQIGGSAFGSGTGVGLTRLVIKYPAGAGPATQNSTGNVFRLPAGYLKHAPEDPKTGQFSALGAPANDLQKDWVFEGNLIVSWDSGPLIIRFVGDVQDVSQMRPMFCEGLACRIAEAISPLLSQSGPKLATIMQEYQRFMGEARTVNAIEQGTTEPPLDDFIACRW